MRTIARILILVEIIGVLFHSVTPIGVQADTAQPEVVVLKLSGPLTPIWGSILGAALKQQWNAKPVQSSSRWIHPVEVSTS